jgi:hypothetical protein
MLSRSDLVKGAAIALFRRQLIGRRRPHHRSRASAVGRTAVDLRQPVQASAPWSVCAPGHRVERRAVGAELTLDPVQPQLCLTLR